MNPALATSSPSSLSSSSAPPPAEDTPRFALDPLIEATVGLIESCRAGRPGAYRRLLIAEDIDEPDTADPYGTANAVNLLATFGRLPRDAANRGSLVAELSRCQDPDTGLFHDWPRTDVPVHHPFHCTAHCVAALDLLDARPAYPLRALHGYADPHGVVDLLESLDWTQDPWNASHRGAGVYAAIKLAHDFASGADESAWEEAYFGWLYENFDAATGLLRSGCLPDQAAAAKPIGHHLAGTFHYLFNFEHARRPLPYPAALVETCLRVHRDKLFPGLGEPLGFVTVDWVYCLTRALRQSGHRHQEARQALLALARELVDRLTAMLAGPPEAWGGLHRVLGAWCALAELQAALPGVFRSRKPLSLVLDRRPFI